MKAGTLYDADTLDEIWPEKKTFGAYYWINLDALKNDTRPVDIYDQKVDSQWFFSLGPGIFSHAG